MREVLFKGQRADTKEWVYGYPNKDRDGDWWITSYYKDGTIDENLVIPETVGQFTGLLDKDGVKIFEGDIIAFNSTYNYYVVFEEGSFYLYHKDRVKDDEGKDCRWGLVQRGIELRPEFTVIGNIHE